jgi:hypothetical protein
VNGINEIQDFIEQVYLVNDSPRAYWNSLLYLTASTTTNLIR